MSRESILAEVSAERSRQDKLFGGPDHDAQHTPAEWVSLITRHLGLSVDDGTISGDPERYRRQMIRVAALAVAALEALERKTELAAAGKPPSWWRKIADGLHEPILVVTRENPARFGEGPQQPYAVAESRANAWERGNHLLRLEPEGV